MNNRKIALLLLASLLVTTAVSCGGESGQNAGTTPNQNTGTTSTEETSPFVKDDLPNDLDLGGKEVKLFIGDYNNAFMQLDSGMIDAVACDLSIAQYQIAANPDKYVQLPTALSTEHYAVGFKKGDTELAQKVTETLKQLDADGTVKQLCEKYASYGISYDNWVLGK